MAAGTKLTLVSQKRPEGHLLLLLLLLRRCSNTRVSTLLWTMVGFIEQMGSRVGDRKGLQIRTHDCGLIGTVRASWVWRGVLGKLAKDAEEIPW